MEYCEVAEARSMPGLRLVLTAYVPGPWGEAAKALLKLRGVSYVPVAQLAMQPNEELLAWTGHRNAPTACLDDEPPLTGWLDILMLAERLGSGPSLLPTDPHERALCLGYSAEICGVDGLGWNRRIAMLRDSADHYAKPISDSYGIRADAFERAGKRVIDVLSGLSAQLARQQAGGSAYLAGNALSAADVYWASFSNMLAPLPAEMNPMPDWLWPLYSTVEPEVAAAIDPALIAHRDRIYRDHIGLPLDY